MKKNNFLIFDFGASNGRAIVATFNGSRFDLDIVHRFDNIEISVAGTVYWDILQLYSNLITGIKLALKKYKKIVSLGIDTWGADGCFLDINGKLLANPISYRDESRYIDAKKLFDIISRKEIFELTCGPVSPENDLFHLYSLKLKNASEIYAGKKFLSIADILNYLLTGRITNEFTRLTMGLMFNQKIGRIEKKILEKVGFPIDWFSEIVQPGNNIGNIKADLCKELEISPIPVIVPATHDTASAIAGIPVTRDRNWAFISSGTWAIMGQKTEKQMVSDDILDAGFANEGGVEVPNIFMKEMVGLWIIQQCRARWIKDSGKNITYNEIEEAASIAKPFNAFIDISMEGFAQPKINMPEYIQTYCKEKGQNIPEGIGEISRCVYESLAMRFKHNNSLMEKLTSQKNEMLYLVGGGVHDKLLCQLSSNATSMPVIAGPIEATSIGNLLMQLKGTGEINNLIEGRQISANASEILNYEPKNQKDWSNAYERYLKILYKDTY
jgi:rhamnulokinase